MTTLGPAAPSFDAPAPARPGLVSVDGNAYPLRSADVRARAEGGVAETVLAQRFENPYSEALEVIYTLPLPADGAVLGYTVRVGETVIVGEVEPRERAAARYREALYEGRTAGLLEEERADTFQQRLGNIPPETPVEVEIRVLHPLGFLASPEGGARRWEYRFPTVVGVRYQGGPGRVADAERLDVDRGVGEGIPARVGLELTIPDPSDGTSAVGSLSHAVRVEREGRASVVRFAEGERLDRDVVVQWRATAPEVGVWVVEGRGLDGDEGRYALLTLVPPTAPGSTFPRDVTVLLDASGSMTGTPLAMGKRVVEDLLRTLGPEDRFEVLVFATRPKSLTGGAVDATDPNVESALRDLRAVRADGCTEMLDALEAALRPLREDSQRQVVLVTDGHIGFEAEVIGRCARGLPGGVRIHAVGIGAAPNRTLTRGLARVGRGVEVFAHDDAGATEAARELRRATARPVLTDLTLAGTALRDVAPAGPWDVLEGRPVVVTAELTPEGGSLELRGSLAGASEPWSRRLEVPGAGEAEGAAVTPLPIGALHGREGIADLEARLAAGEDPAELKRQIEARGMRHRIASAETSLVAVAETPSMDPRSPRRREKLAVELPAGVSAEGTGLLAAADPAAPLASPASLDSRMRLGVRAAAYEPSDVALDGDEAQVYEHPMSVAPPHRIRRRAEILRAEDEMLVLELEAPSEGWVLPRGDVTVVFADGTRATGEVVPDESTPGGPHARGILVRLALRLERALTNAPSGQVELRWSEAP